jgi:hypothetical protein
MLAGILRRIRALEQRSATSEAEQLPRLPQWLLKGWEAQGIPMDEFGQPNFAAIKRNRVEERAAADPIPAETEEGRSPDVAVPSEALRFD